MNLSRSQVLGKHQAVAISSGHININGQITTEFFAVSLLLFRLNVGNKYKGLTI